ncbi:MAG: hypothetical protein R2848_00460 [Thermomicrobiales bacterium]
MTVLEDLSTDDQIVLMRTPNALVMATAYAEQDGVFSIRKELKAGLQAAIDGATAFPDNQIIQRLALEMNTINPEEAEEVKGRARKATDPEDLVEERNPSTSRPWALQLAGESLAIMNANATMEETVEFKYWLYSIADQVTLASKAGGFLGFGGTRVSPAEAQFLDELRDALGIADENVPSAEESNAKPDDDETPSVAAAPAEETEAERIARLDADSVRADEPVGESVPAERPEDV